MKRTFCHLCGTRLDQKEEFVWYCPSCDNTLYANSKPCADLALFNSRGELLIAKRGREPNKGKYDLPGGFVDYNETYEEALFREANEELGLTPEDITTPKYVTSFTFVYPFGKEVYLNLVSVFQARLKDDATTVSAKDDVESVEFRQVNSLKHEDLSSRDYLDIMMLADKINQTI
jgi:NADH pyrophosphatase NudC (nudix superfamily)